MCEEGYFVAEDEVEGYEPCCEDEVGDQEVGGFAVFVADEVHQGDDDEDSAEELGCVQHVLGYAPTLVFGRVLVEDEEYDGHKADDEEVVEHF